MSGNGLSTPGPAFNKEKTGYAAKTPQGVNMVEDLSSRNSNSSVLSAFSLESRTYADSSDYNDYTILPAISNMQTKGSLPPLQSLPQNIRNVDAIKLEELYPHASNQMRQKSDIQRLVSGLKQEELDYDITRKYEPSLLGIKAIKDMENKEIAKNKPTVNNVTGNPAVSTPAISNRDICCIYTPAFDYVLCDQLGMSESETINFHEGFVPMLYKFERINNFGPLAWISLILKDPLIRPIRDEVLQHKKKSLFNASNESETHHQNRMLRYLGVDDIKPLKIENTAVLNQATEAHNLIDDPDTKVRADPSSMHSPEKITIQQIISILPNKKTIWLSVKRFFSDVYPLLPYLDRNSFVSDVENLLSGNCVEDIHSEAKVEKINITKRLDFATLGTLLLVLKFAEDSLVVDDEIEDSSIQRTESEKYLLQHPLPKNIINLAQACLNQFKLLRKCALPVFQFALLMKEFEFMSGTSDGTASDSQIFISMLIQLGITIGLNRDPCKFDIIISKGKLGNLWRKIWYRLVAMDTRQYILFGTSKTLNADLFDTLLPRFDEDSANIEDHDLERKIIEKIKLNYKFDQVMIDLADYICTFKTEPNARILLKKVVVLEKMLTETFGTMKDILQKNINNVEKINKIWDFGIYVQASGLVMCVYQDLFVHYQKLSNFNAAKFFKEKGILHFVDIFANFECCSTNCHKFFGIGNDLVIAQTIVPVIHKGWITYTSTYVSSTLMIEKYGSNPAYSKKIQVLKIICKLVTETGTWYLPCLKKLAKRHFFSWKLLKAHTCIINLIRSKKFIFKSLLHLYNFMENMTETDCINFMEITNLENGKLNKSESPLFKSIKNKIMKNCVCPENDMSFETNLLDLNSMVIDPQGKPFDFDVVLDNLVPMEPWNKPMEEDRFWRDVYLQSQSYGHPTSTFSGQQKNGTVPSNPVALLDTPNDIELGNFNYELNNSPFQGSNASSTANQFVDRTIYEMFN